MDNRSTRQRCVCRFVFYIMAWDRDVVGDTRGESYDQKNPLRRKSPADGGLLRVWGQARCVHAATGFAYSRGNRCSPWDTGACPRSALEGPSEHFHHFWCPSGAWRLAHARGSVLDLAHGLSCVGLPTRLAEHSPGWALDCEECFDDCGGLGWCSVPSVSFCHWFGPKHLSLRRAVHPASRRPLPGVSSWMAIRATAVI